MQSIDSNALTTIATIMTEKHEQKMTARNAPPPQSSSSPPSSSDSSSSSSKSSSPKLLRWPNLSEAENTELDTLGKKYLSDLTKDELAERNALLAHHERLSVCIYTHHCHQATVPLILFSTIESLRRFCGLAILDCPHWRGATLPF